MDISAINSILSLYTESSKTDSSSVASKLTSRLLTNRDSNGDGYLTNSDVSELSSDAFSKLDTDGDGKLGSSEITSAFEAQLDNIKLAAQSGGRGVLAALRKTPAALLMQASKTASQPAASTTTTNSTSSSTSSGSSILDVTA
jgi:hypothetical protein